VKIKLPKEKRSWGIFEEGIASITILLTISLLLMLFLLARSSLPRINVLILIVLSVTSLSFMLLAYYMAISDMFSDIIDSLLITSNIPENIAEALNKVKNESSLIRRNFGVLLLIVALSLKVMSLSNLNESLKLIFLLLSSSVIFLFSLLKYDEMFNKYIFALTNGKIISLTSINLASVKSSIRATKRDLILRLIAILFFIGVLSRFMVLYSETIWTIVMITSLIIAMIVLINFNFISRSVVLFYNVSMKRDKKDKASSTVKEIKQIKSALSIANKDRKDREKFKQMASSAGEKTDHNTMKAEKSDRARPSNDSNLISGKKVKGLAKPKEVAQKTIRDDINANLTQKVKTTQPSPSVEKTSNTRVKPISKEKTIMGDEAVNAKKEDEEDSLAVVITSLEEELLKLREKVRNMKKQTSEILFGLLKG